MSMLAIIGLGVSILGLALLFLLKYFEERRAYVVAPALRAQADIKAIELKHMLQWCAAESRKLAPTSVRVLRAVLHDLALGLAALSRASERQAHRLADIVSHKHRFERRESKNEFLKQVSEVKSNKTEA